MKARLPLDVILSRKKLGEVKAFAHEIAQEEFERKNREATRRVFMLLAVALNERHGFGKDRITRLFAELDKLMGEHAKDTEFWEHVHRRCMQIGVEFTGEEKKGEDAA